MNAAIESRTQSAEQCAIRQLKDAELESLLADAEPMPWIEQCTDAELEAVAAGGPIPARFTGWSARPETRHPLRVRH